MDVCGPMETTSHGGSRYFVKIIDHFSRKVFVSFLSQKSAVINVFRECKAMAEKQSNRKIKHGTEFVNRELFTVPYTPEQNGVAERMNRTIVERAKCMLTDARLGKEFWGEAIHHAAYLINRSVNRTVDKTTPEEVWCGHRPYLAKLDVFGNHVMVHVPKTQRLKWDKKAVEMIFVGYADTQKGFRCFDPLKRKVVISRDVIFLEPKMGKIDSTISVDLYEDEDESTDANAIDKKQHDDGPSDGETSEEDDVYDDAEDPDYSPVGAIKSSVTNNLRQSERNRVPVIRPDYVSYMVFDRDVSDPLTPIDALKNQSAADWKEAMNNEKSALVENQTWVTSASDTTSYVRRC